MFGYLSDLHVAIQSGRQVALFFIASLHTHMNIRADLPLCIFFLQGGNAACVSQGKAIFLLKNLIISFLI